MTSRSVLPAFICSRICPRRSTAKSARESASVSFWQTRQRSSLERFITRSSRTGSAADGCASFAITEKERQSRSTSNSARGFTLFFSCCLNRRVDRFHRPAVKLFGLFRKLLVRNHQLLATLRLTSGNSTRALLFHPGFVHLGRDSFNIR